MATELSGLSIYTIASDGLTVEYPLQFASGTLRLSYVRVAVEGEVDGEGNQLYRTFTQVPGDPGMIRIEGTAPAAGLNITFQRIIPKDDLLHKYSNGAILDYPSLDESHLQLLMAIQELMDGFGFQNISTDLNMNNRDILNVGKLTLQDFGTGIGPSFQDLLTQANTQLALNQAEVAKAKLQADAAAASAVQASGFSDAAAMSAVAAASEAAAAEAAAELVDPRMDAAEQDIAAFKDEVSAQLSMFVGAVLPLTVADNYTPFGCVPANGGEYTRAQFPSFFDDYLVSGKLLTCTYSAWAAQVDLTGNCTKYALDTDAQKFRVPLYKDGDSITQATSAAELGKSVKAGLPNITGSFAPKYTGGASYSLDSSVEVSGCFSKTNMGSYPTFSIVASNQTGVKVNIDASKGGTDSTYGKSTTVTDEQVRLRHFVVVASAQNNASVFDWSNYMEGLASKVNLNMDNLTATGTASVAYNSSLGGQLIGVSWPGSGGTSAPAPNNGEFKASATSTASGQYLRLFRTGTLISEDIAWSSAAGQLLVCTTDVRKSDTVVVISTAPTSPSLAFSSKQGG